LKAVVKNCLERTITHDGYDKQTALTVDLNIKVITIVITTNAILHFNNACSVACRLMRFGELDHLELGRVSEQLASAYLIHVYLYDT